MASRISFDQQFVPINNPKTVPAFVNKLYCMVSDTSSNSMIQWAADGASFYVLKPDDFARDVLPRFFKHNNFSSFVRQLNMYGFHKVPQLQQSAIASDNELWQFMNEYFQRNRPDLLAHVKRKSGKDDDSNYDIKAIIDDLSSIKQQQTIITSELRNMQKDNQLLWSQHAEAIERHNHQQEVINRILRFLATLFSTENFKEVLAPKKRRLMIESENSQKIEDLQESVMELMVPQQPPVIASKAAMSNYSENVNNLTNDSIFLNEQMEDMESRIMNFGDRIGVDLSPTTEAWDFDRFLNEAASSTSSGIPAVQANGSNQKSSNLSQQLPSASRAPASGIVDSNKNDDNDSVNGYLSSSNGGGI